MKRDLTNEEAAAVHGIPPMDGSPDLASSFQGPTLGEQALTEVDRLRARIRELEQNEHHWCTLIEDLKEQLHAGAPRICIDGLPPGRLEVVPGPEAAVLYYRWTGPQYSELDARCPLQNPQRLGG